MKMKNIVIFKKIVKVFRRKTKTTTTTTIGKNLFVLVRVCRHPPSFFPRQHQKIPGTTPLSAINLFLWSLLLSLSLLNDWPVRLLPLLPLTRVGVGRGVWNECFPFIAGTSSQQLVEIFSLFFAPLSTNSLVRQDLPPPLSFLSFMCVLLDGYFDHLRCCSTTAFCRLTSNTRSSSFEKVRFFSYSSYPDWLLLTIFSAGSYDWLIPLLLLMMWWLSQVWNTTIVLFLRLVLADLSSRLWRWVQMHS